MTLLTCIGSSYYDYVKQDTGERKQGASFIYLSKASSSGGSIRSGWTPIEMRIPFDMRNAFDKPAIYDIEFGYVPRSIQRGGGVDQIFVGAKLIRPVELDFPSLFAKEQAKA
ncbi:hypothetical protein [Pseudanabaena yagii]|uniref:Uncharacterized protein n=1 Tax=Pseudanabaena yagii GIHE-NHR1 TaxID=2722753 RepID=A0ABX1LS47_9CYAN|nr:hypothetical protein [Pseudanabaena yagii]NMF57885.1 hypothetical protein [Pseudanabaena yagii GIHE-NHR1]